MVEFFDLGKRNVYCWLMRSQCCIEQLWQAVQRLRPEHQVHVWGAPDDGRALLRGDATTDADDHARTRLLERAPEAELGENFFLRLLADRTGIEQQHVGLGRVVGQLQAVRYREHVRHAGGVVLVHLTAEGFYEELARHISVCRGAGFYRQIRGGG